MNDHCYAGELFSEPVSLNPLKQVATNNTLFPKNQSEPFSFAACSSNVRISEDCDVEQILCTICNISFTSEYSMKRHVKKFHPYIVVPASNFKCDECDSSFSRKKSLKYHKIKKHFSVKCNVVCPVSHKNIEKSEIESHISNVHDTEIETSILNSCTFEKSLNRKALSSNNTPFTGKQSEQISLVACSSDAGILEDCDSDEDKFFCPECNSSFSSKYCMKRHVKQFHPHFVFPVKQSQNFKCDECKSSFSLEKSLKHHKRRRHMTVKWNVVCPVCRENIEKSEILNHISSVHNIEIEISVIQFSTFEEFLNWKVQMERSTRCKFISCGGSKGTSYFHCHRSGHFHSKSRGIRPLKISKKIDAYCPASFKVKKAEGGGCTVNFVSTHVGHINDLGNIFLTNGELNSPTTEMSAKVPYDSVNASTKRQLTQYIKKLKSRHKNSLMLTSQIVEHKIDGWLITAENGTKPYEIKKIKKICKCQILCKECNTCIHQYVCTCEDSSVQWNMCKHIHYLSQILKKSYISTDTTPDEQFIVDENQEPSITNEELSGQTAHSQASLKEIQEYLKNRFAEVIDSLTNAEQVEYMEKILKSVTPKLNSLGKIDSKKKKKRIEN